jgi:hypothetical protein
MSTVDKSKWSEVELTRRIRLEPNAEAVRKYCYAGQLRNGGDWVLPYRYPGQPVNVYGIYYALKAFPAIVYYLCAPDVTSEILNFNGLLVNWAMGSGWSVSSG